MHIRVLKYFGLNAAYDGSIGGISASNVCFQSVYFTAERGTMQNSAPQLQLCLRALCRRVCEMGASLGCSNDLGCFGRRLLKYIPGGDGSNEFLTLPAFASDALSSKMQANILTRQLILFDIISSSCQWESVKPATTAGYGEEFLTVHH